MTRKLFTYIFGNNNNVPLNFKLSLTIWTILISTIKNTTMITNLIIIKLYKKSSDIYCTRICNKKIRKLQTRNCT